MYDAYFEATNSNPVDRAESISINQQVPRVAQPTSNCHQLITTYTYIYMDA